MENIQTWYDKLSKSEKYLFFILITYIILTSLIFLAFRDPEFFFLYNLLIGILIFTFSLYFAYFLIPRKPKVIYFYGDSRSNEEYYSEKRLRTEIDLRSLDKEENNIEKIKSVKTKFAPGCSICHKRELLPYVCKYCRRSFCSEHRLPEKHSCDGL
ncbi:MAG: hypothetical protein HeimC3_47730 [Candidatus Heimdallarchaeota archaeon LC_3]|nr:MAG: hypothetical protein HeimC3_47730 [Candidatus Heimdallarchaeota archaeon LC_3]